MTYSKTEMRFRRAREELSRRESEATKSKSRMVIKELFDSIHDMKMHTIRLEGDLKGLQEKLKVFMDGHSVAPNTERTRSPLLTENRNRNGFSLLDSIQSQIRRIQIRENQKKSPVADYSMVLLLSRSHKVPLDVLRVLIRDDEELWTLLKPYWKQLWAKTNDISTYCEGELK
jgi:hypothetical protein